MLFDTHTHLNDPDLFDKAEELIKRAKDFAVTRMIVPSYDYASCVRAIELAERFPSVYAAVGFHPHDAKDVTDADMDTLRQWCSHEKVVAVGEIGLDYHYDHSPRAVQECVFRAQIELAKEVRLPIIIHDREAHADILRVLEETGASDVGGIMHCFSGGVDMMHACLKMNFHISLGGPITFKNAKKPVQVAEAVPTHRLLIETDAPWLAPEPLRGKQNEPANVRFVAEKLAEVKGITVAELAEATWRNALGLFSRKMHS